MLGTPYDFIYFNIENMDNKNTIIIHVSKIYISVFYCNI